jgi:hypothetical protein
MYDIKSIEFYTMCRLALSEVYSTFPKELFMEGLTNYETMSLLVDGVLPQEKKNILKENEILKQIKMFYAGNSKEFPGILNENNILTSIFKINIIKEDEELNRITGQIMKNKHDQIDRMATSNSKLAKSNSIYKKVAIGVVIAAALYASYKIYKNYLSKAARSCKGKSGLDKQNCMAKFKSGAAKAQISQLKTSTNLCNKSNNPQLCREKILAKIKKLEGKL